jgi:anti-anti-sigma factor
MEFTLEKIKKGKVQILSLNGYMGKDEFGQVDQVLTHLLEQKQGWVILNLTKLTFATANSLARFLICGREFQRHGGELKLVGLSPELSRLAEMAGFSTKKDFEPNVTTALNTMSQVPQVKPPKKKK